MLWHLITLFDIQAEHEVLKKCIFHFLLYFINIKTAQFKWLCIKRHYNKGKSVTTVVLNRFYKDIQFTCNEIVTHAVIEAKNNI